MGVRPKSESSCQTQFTIPPFITKKKILDNKSYMRNLHFPKIPSGNTLEAESQPHARLLTESDDTIPNLVVYEQESGEKFGSDVDCAPAVESRKGLSYKSFFKQNKFSRNNLQVPMSTRLQPNDESDSACTDTKLVFLKDNPKTATEVSNFLKYLRRKGTDFLTVFDLDNLNSLIDDISNMKHFAEPVSYEDSAVTLQTDSNNREHEDSASSQDNHCVSQRSLSVGIGTCDSPLEGSPCLEGESTVGVFEKVSVETVRHQSTAHLEETSSVWGKDSVETVKHRSADRVEDQPTFDDLGKASFKSAKHQSLHSAVPKPVAIFFGRDVDDTCLPRGKALKCVTVTRDKHVRVYIKGKSTCTTIDLSPEHLSHTEREKSDVQSVSEELVKNISFFENEVSQDTSTGVIEHVLNDSPNGEMNMSAAEIGDKPVSEKREQSKKNKCEMSATEIEDKPVSGKSEQTKNVKCEIITDFQGEDMQRRLMFLEVCKKLNKATRCESEKVAKGISENFGTLNDDKDWKLEFIPGRRTMDFLENSVNAETDLHSEMVGANLAEDESVITIKKLYNENVSVQTPDIKDRSARVCEEKSEVGYVSKEKIPPFSESGKVVKEHIPQESEFDNVSKEKIAPRLVKSDMYFGNELCFTGFRRNGMGGQIYSDHLAKTNEGKYHIIESCLRKETALENKCPSFVSKCENVDTIMNLPDDEPKTSSDLREGIGVSAEKISLRNKISYLDVTEDLGKGGKELEDSKNVEDPKATSNFKGASAGNLSKKSIVIDIVSGKKKASTCELTVHVNPLLSYVRKASDDTKQPSAKDQKGTKMTPYSLDSICSKSAALVVSENVSRLLERVVKSSVELEKFDFTFANFNQIFMCNLSRRLETPSSSDVDVTRKWIPEAFKRVSRSGVESNVTEDSGSDVNDAMKYDSCSKEEREVGSEQSSTSRSKDSRRPRYLYRKKCVKNIYFSSEDSRDSDRTEESSSFESSKSNISSVVDAVSDTHQTIRYLNEDVVCSKLYLRSKSNSDLRTEEQKEIPNSDLKVAKDTNKSENNKGFRTTDEEITRDISKEFISNNMNPASMVDPKPKPNSDLRIEEQKETPDSDLKMVKDTNKSKCNKDFLTTIEEITRDMSEEFISIRNKMNPASTLLEDPESMATPLHSVRFDTVNAPRSTEVLAKSSLLNADLERLKHLCEDVIKRHSQDDREDVDDSEMIPVIHEPLVPNGNLTHSYCDSCPETALIEESYSKEQSSDHAESFTPTTSVPRDHDAKSQLYHRKQSQEAKVHSFMTPNRNDKSLSKDKYGLCSPSGSGYTIRNRTVIKCRTGFNAEECSSSNAKRVESLVQRLCQKLNVDNPQTFNSPQSFVTHFERVGKKLYLTPIENLKSDLKFVLGKGAKGVKPPLRREDASRQRARQDLRRESADKNTNLRDKIAKFKRKPN